MTGANKALFIKEEVVMTVVGEVELESCVEVAGGLYPSASSNKIVPLFLAAALTTTWIV